MAVEHVRPGRRPGPKPRLSRELIVDAAVEMGVESVSIGAVATTLGVAPAGLYRYISGRDDLVAAGLERILGEAPLPPDDSDWRAFLETEAWTRWSLLLRYAGLVRRYEGRLVWVAARRMERLVRGLTARGFSLTDAMTAVDAVLDLIDDAADQAARLRDPDDPDRPSEPMRAVLDACAPDLRAVVEAIVDDPVRHVERKLALVLDGIGARFAP
ncbi:TetR/AcrR family transcriptional regulator [Pseudonocardia endophytica]|uniref:TetR family transcriptional regulator n=1 Tax=Pseudonocardia endophytica TaxID=401976 RepID=A0A4R1HVM5_PSEEN|nr:TetR/AcrR family transcriptional regulator [Pseudonocardia endophytica]TCK21542.1 TetR family transcriptional regulator [Pseudonocardia endophytica]